MLDGSANKSTEPVTNENELYRVEVTMPLKAVLPLCYVLKKYEQSPEAIVKNLEKSIPMLHAPAPPLAPPPIGALRWHF